MRSRELHAELLVGSHSWASRRCAEQHQPRKPHRCGGCRRDRRAWRAAHWHTKQPGPTAGLGAQKTHGSTSNNQRHTATRSVLQPRTRGARHPSTCADALCSRRITCRGSAGWSPGEWGRGFGCRRSRSRPGHGTCRSCRRRSQRGRPRRRCTA